jgi:hypothetical protein
MSSPKVIQNGSFALATAQKAKSRGNRFYSARALYAGLGVGRIESILPADERVAAIVAEATRLLNGD